MTLQHQQDIKKTIQSTIDKNINIRAATVFLLSMVCYIIIYFYELSHFTLSIDEEPSDNYYHTIANGRWGDAILKHFILPDPYIPFFTQFLALLILSATSAMICLRFRFNAKKSIIFSVACCALPQVAYQLQYTQQVDTYATGCLLAVISTSVLFFNGRKLISIIVSILSLAFAMGIYQSLIMIPITIFIYKCITDEVNLVRFVKKSFSYAVIIVSGSALYILITRLFINHYGNNQMGYFSERVRWLHEPFLKVVHITFREVSVYFTGKSVYGLEIFSLASVFILISAVIFLYKNKYFSFILIVILSLTPFLFNFISGGYQSPRVLSSLPYCFAFLAVIALEKINYKAISVLLIILTLVASAKSSKLFYSEYLRGEQDRAFATRLISSIYNSMPDFNQNSNKIYFFGTPDLPEPLSFDRNVDSFDWSWFDMFGGSNARITHFIKYIGFADFKTPEYSESKKIIPDIKNMPVYPDSGSIRFFPKENILVVKLGTIEGAEY